MSDPAASIKSIYSGKTNEVDVDLYEYGDSSDFDAGHEASHNVTMGDIRDRLGSAASPSSHMSNLSISSRNLRTLNGTLQAAPMYQLSSSTNISIASSTSEYQHTGSEISEASQVPDDAKDYEGLAAVGSDRNTRDPLQFEENRPVSRNSTTSCLSTTATKDGVEGKRFHRYGPSPYSAAAIQNMLHSHSVADPSPTHARATLLSTSGAVPPSPGAAELPDESQYSFQTTNAELDGDGGDHRSIRIERYSDMAPPVTLKEKISLLDNDR